VYGGEWLDRARLDALLDAAAARKEELDNGHASNEAAPPRE
jgi:hypothetical protein